MDTELIVIRGDTSEKLVDGRRVLVTPFISLKKRCNFNQLGIGLLLPENTTTWGLIDPYLLIQLWRGMKILEQIDIVYTNETLCACFTVAKDNMNKYNYYLNKLSSSCGSIHTLQKIRREVFDSVPTTSELDAMLTKIQDSGIQIDSQEIEVELMAGRIAITPRIMDMIPRLRKNKFSPQTSIS